MNKTWLENLKVGSTVIQRGSGGIGSSDSIVTVERFTKTLIITSLGGRFKRGCGWSVGGSQWHREHLEEATEERLDAVRRRILSQKLRHFKEWDKLSLENLRKIVALCKEGIKESKSNT